MFHMLLSSDDNRHSMVPQCIKRYNVSFDNRHSMVPQTVKRYNVSLVVITSLLIATAMSFMIESDLMK